MKIVLSNLVTPAASLSAIHKTTQQQSSMFNLAYDDKSCKKASIQVHNETHIEKIYFSHRKLGTKIYCIMTHTPLVEVTQACLIRSVILDSQFSDTFITNLFVPDSIFLKSHFIEIMHGKGIGKTV